MDPYTDHLNNMQTGELGQIVPYEEISQRNGNVWHLPHRDVTSTAKPDKIGSFPIMYDPCP